MDIVQSKYWPRFLADSDESPTVSLISGRLFKLQGEPITVYEKLGFVKRNLIPD